MRVAVFNASRFGSAELLGLGADQHQFLFLEDELTPETVTKAAGHGVICGCPARGRQRDLMVAMAREGVEYLILGSEWAEEWDLPMARRMGLTVVGIPARSPHAVAEHAVALMLALNRHLLEASQRITHGNFDRSGLRGFDVHEQTIGILGLEEVGKVTARILHGFGARLLAWDPQPDQTFARRYQVYFADWDILLARSNILFIHLPLTMQTTHLLDAAALQAMPRGSMVIHVGRPEILDLDAIADALDSGQLGYFGWDLFPEEKTCTQHDLLYEGPDSDEVVRLARRPNVLITHRQGVLTDAAQKHRAVSTLSLLAGWSREMGRDKELSSVG